MGENAGESAGIDRQLERIPPNLRAQMEKIWSVDEWERLGRDGRLRLVSWIWKLIEADAHEALAAERMGLRVESHISRTISEVDERGWLELNRIQDEALWATLAVKAESAERLAESGREGFPVASAMLCYEMSPGPDEEPEA